MSFSGCSSVTLGGLEGAAGSAEDISLRNSSGQPVTLSIGNNNANSTFSGGLVGLGGIVKIGSGSLVLAGMNAYAGATAVNNGSLQLNNPLATISGSVAAGAELAVQSGNGTTGWSAAQLGSLVSPGNFTWGANSVLGIDTTNGDFNYGGNIAGQMGLVKLGSNMLTLTGANSYSGSTTINGGVLAMSNIPNSTPGSILINSGGALSVSGPYTNVTNWLNSGLINQSSAGALALAGASNEAVSMGSYSSLSLGAVSAGATFSGSLAPAGNTYRLGGGGALTVSTALTGGNSLVVNGDVNLTGNNSYSGNTTINAGMLAMAYLPNNTASSILINSGGALSVSSGPHTNVTDWLNSGLISTSSSGALALTGQSNEAINFSGYNGLSLGAAPGGATFGGTITQGNNGYIFGGGGGPLTVTMTNIPYVALTFVGGMINWDATLYPGGPLGPPGGWAPIHVNAGTLDAMTPSSLPVQSYGNSNVLYVASGAVLAVQAQTANTPNGWASADINAFFNTSPGMNIFVPGSAFGVDVVSGGTFTQTGSFPYNSGVGLVKMGGGTMLLNGTTYAATTTISAGALQLGDGSTNGSLDGGAGLGTGLIVNNAALVFANPSAQTYSGNISGSGNLTKTSNGLLTLAGDNAYAGGTTINAGTLQVGSAAALGWTNGSLAVNSGALDVNGNNVTVGALLRSRHDRQQLPRRLLHALCRRRRRQRRLQRRDPEHHRHGRLDEDRRRQAGPGRRERLQRPDDDLRGNAGARRHRKRRRKLADDDGLEHRLRRGARSGRELADGGQPQRRGRGDHREQSRPSLPYVHLEFDRKSDVRGDDVRREYR